MTTSDPKLHAIYEEVCAEQEAAVALAQAWASISKELLQNREFPLGFPGEYSREEVLEFFDSVLRAPIIANEEAAMVEARKRLQNRRDAALDARREFRESE